MIRASLSIPTASLLCITLACSGGDGTTAPDPNQVASVEVSPSQVSLTAIGDTRQLTAVAKNAQGTSLDGKAVSWSVAPAAVVSVSSGGVVTAVAEGTATVTATIEGKTGSAQVTVQQQGSRLAFATQPSNTAAGADMAPGVAVEVRDAQGHVVTSSTATITLALGANPGGTTLGGTTTRQAAGGVATFSDLTLTKASAGYTLHATSAGLLDVTSQPFDVAAGPLAQLAWLTQPVDVQVLDAMPEVVVAAHDAYGNPVGGAAVTVSIGHSFEPRRGLDADLNATSLLPDGAAHFSGIKVRNPGPGYTLLATSGSSQAESAPFDAHAVFDQLAMGGTNFYGSAFACGRTPHAWYCWGRNFSGQLGSPTADNLENAPFMVNATERYLQVDLGLAHACGRASDGTVYCWGDNSHGQVGVTGAASLNTPTAVAGTGPAGLVITRISAGGDHSCGLATDQAIYCWGRNDAGQLGDGGNADQSAPVKVAGSGTAPLLFVAVEAGEGFTCGIVNTTRAVYCWGENSAGTLGDGSGVNSPVPVQVQGSGVAPLQFASLTSLLDTMCGLTSAQAAYCWGNNLLGALGSGSTQGDALSPEAVSGVATWNMISEGSFVGCGVSTAGSGYCWGRNVDGELGSGPGASSNVPVPLAAPGGETWAGLFPAAIGTCGLTQTGAVYCWGDNENGFVGDGTFTTRTLPTRIIQ